MHPVRFALAALLVIAACKKPATSATQVRTSRIEGVLAYRASCQSGPVVPFPGQRFDGGPVLYLTDKQDQVRGGYYKPNAAGQFQIVGVGPGEYRLRLAAGELRHFWQGVPVTGIRIVVPETATRIELGTTCVDGMPPADVEITAAWNDGDRSVAAPGDMLHLEDAAGHVRLNVSAVVEGERRELPAEWYPAAASAALTVLDTEVAWTPGAVTATTVMALAGDGRGSFVPLSMPLRMHARRAEGKRYGGWLDFSNAATLAAFTPRTFNAFVESGAAGARMSAESSPGYVEASLVSRVSYLAPTVAVSAVLDIAQLGLGAMIELNLDTTFGAQVSARLSATSDGGIMELLDGQGTTIVYGAWRPTPAAILQLQFDWATRTAVFSVGEYGPAKTITAVIAEPVTRPVGRLAPRVSLYSGGNPAAPFDVTVAGLYVDSSALLFELAIGPQTRDGRVYDAFPFAAEKGALAMIDAGLYMGAGPLDVSISEPRAVSTYLVDYEGAPMTLFTEQPAEWVALFSTIDAIDPETMAPINDGAAMLY